MHPITGGNMTSKKTHSEWKELVKKFNSSGQSMTQFSKDNGVKPSTFIYWVKMFKKPKGKVSNLVKLPTKQILHSEPVQISINSIKLEFPGTISTNKIAEIISVIREIRL